MRDEFLSEEDLGIVDLSEDELFAYWDMWLEQSQITNDVDKDVYTHGVFSSIRDLISSLSDGITT